MQPQDTIHTQNQCIFQVHASISNARPFIQYIKSYLSTKILFSKISFFFQNFVPFCLIFNFFLFFSKKIQNFLLFIIIVHHYCSPLLFIVLFTYVAIHFFFHFFLTVDVRISLGPPRLIPQGAKVNNRVKPPIEGLELVTIG